ncbi:MAG: hypothetical protein ACRER7_02150 [Gammaproteobacteria bacterium]
MSTQSDDKLDAALGKLPHTIESARDLWPGIAARIERQHTLSWQRNAWRYGTAIAAVIIVAVVATFTTLSMHTASPGNPVIAITVPAIPPNPAEIGNLRAKFAAQLSSDINLPPKARAALVDNLRMMHEDILRTQAALKKYPNDVNLQSLLFNLYRQEAQLMNEAQQAQAQTTVRTSI